MRGPSEAQGVWDCIAALQDDRLRSGGGVLNQGLGIKAFSLSYILLVLQGVPGEAGAPGLVGPRVSVLLAIPGGLLGPAPSLCSSASDSQPHSRPGSRPHCAPYLPAFPWASTPSLALIAPWCLCHRVNEVSQVNVALLVPRASRVPVVSLALLALMVPK